MGYALITGEVGEGRYTIQLDWGETLRLGYVAAATTAAASLELKVIEQQAIVDDADAAEDALRANLADAFNAIAAQIAAEPGIYPASAQQVFESLLGDLRRLEAGHAPARINLRRLKAQLALAQKRLFVWENLVCLVNRSAWCADFTEGASGYVATLDIPGESDLILIAPGARAPVTAGDGYMQARELMSPEQAFFNVAILPGWQKYLPTYRWGTITAIDDDAETVSVDLFDATSSAQRLSVNQAESLSGVAVEYMECGHTIFEVGDRVVVQFVNQDWEQPRVIGFLDNPRACRWPVVGSARGAGIQQYYAIFGDRSGTDIADLHSGAATVEGRVNRGAWFTMTRAVVSGTGGFGGTNVAQYTADTQPTEPNVGSIYLNVVLQPFVTADTAGASILPSDYAGGAYIDSEPQVPATSLPRSAYAIIEVRATLGGDVIFNAAIEEIGYSTEAKAARVRGVGGYLEQLEIVAQFTYGRVLSDEYQLFSETGD